MRGHNGNAASLDAYRTHQTRSGNAREMVYALFLEALDGLTSKEVAQRMGWPLNAVSGRLTELEKEGRIRGVGVRRLGAEVHVAVRRPVQLSLMEVA